MAGNHNCFHNISVIEIDDSEEIEEMTRVLKYKNVKVRLTVETENENLYAALLRHYKARAYVIRQSSSKLGSLYKKSNLLRELRDRSE